MRIAIVSDTFAPDVNGVAKTMSRFSTYLEEQGHDYHFFIPGEKNEIDHRFNRFLGKRFPIYDHLNIPLTTYSYFRIRMDKVNPDVIHIVTQGVLGYFALTYAKRRNIPVVTSYTTDLPNYLRFYNADILEPAIWKYLRAYHDQSHTVLVPSQHSINQLKRQTMTKLSLWGRGVDPNQFNPLYRCESFRNMYKDGDELLFLYVGRLAKEKKIDVLLEASNLLEVPHKLLIVGDGPIRSELERKAGPNVRFLGYMTGRELAKAYASSDVFVFPSENETYGNVILEAYASATPVIAPFKGGITENLNEKTSIFFDDNTAEEFAEAMLKFHEDRERLVKMRHHALRHAEGRSWKALFSELIYLYRSAMYDMPIRKEA